MNESVRLLKLLIGLSGATDLGMGLKVGEPVRSAALGAGLARAFELDDEGNREALYATLLTEAVCVGPPSGQGGRLSIRRCASPTQTSVNHGAKRPRNRPKAAEGALAPSRTRRRRQRATPLPQRSRGPRPSWASRHARERLDIESSEMDDRHLRRAQLPARAAAQRLPAYAASTR